MSNQAERIHAALLRLKAERSGSGRRVEAAPSADAGPQKVVVNEQNLAALSLSSVDLPGTRAPRGAIAKFADG